MLVAILILMVFQMLFTMALVGHLSSIEKMIKALISAKVEEIKMWNNRG